MVLRFYIRLNRKQKIGPDDWLIIPALVCKIAHAGVLKEADA